MNEPQAYGSGNPPPMVCDPKLEDPLGTPPWNDGCMMIHTAVRIGRVPDGTQNGLSAIMIAGENLQGQRVVLHTTFRLLWFALLKMLTEEDLRTELYEMLNQEEE